jgi:hypothetical protein
MRKFILSSKYYNLRGIKSNRKPAEPKNGLFCHENGINYEIDI